MYSRIISRVNNNTLNNNIKSKVYNATRYAADENNERSARVEGYPPGDDAQENRRSRKPGVGSRRAGARTRRHLRPVEETREGGRPLQAGTVRRQRDRTRPEGQSPRNRTDQGRRTID